MLADLLAGKSLSCLSSIVGVVRAVRARDVCAMNTRYVLFRIVHWSPVVGCRGIIHGDESLGSESAVLIHTQLDTQMGSA